MDNILFWLVPVASVLALCFAYYFHKQMMKESEGTPQMIKIAAAVRKGAMSYLKQQYKIVGWVFLGLVILFSIMAYGFHVQNAWVPIAFLTGGFFSGLSGFLGMKTATYASARTANAARNSLNAGLRIAFRSGAVMGLVVVGLGLLDISFWYLLLNAVIPADALTPTHKLCVITTTMLTFGMGASTQALFARVGGGIYTKAADVGADLVGKVEAGIPEDDPRNPATIADNVGDNVGDVAGMGADLYESYCGSILATAALGAAAFIHSADTVMQFKAVIAPMLIAAVGIILSIIGIFAVRTKENATMKDLLGSLAFGTNLSSVLIVAATFLILWLLQLDNWIWISCAVVVGLLVGIVIGRSTEYYTSQSYRPTQKLSESGKTGPATVIISGIGLGMLSTAIPVIAVVVGIIASYLLASAGDFANVGMGLYGIGVAAVGMLSTLGITLATDAYGPVADNAGGNAEMSGLGAEVRKRTDALDSLGNTTAATGKGFAIGSAALTGLALLASYIEEIRIGLTRLGNVDLTFADGSSISVANATFIDFMDYYEVHLMNPKVLSGMFLGSMMAFLFCGLTMNAVGRAAGHMVDEVRRQFRDIKGILTGEAEPDYERCVEISTKGAQREMVIPSLIAIVAPILTGFIFGVPGVLGLLIGGLSSGFVLAIFMANAGGAWDNAKKYVEEGNFGGKGGEVHKATVVGDTVGDPFKDTSGPSLNILIKLMSMVAIVMAGLTVAWTVLRFSGRQPAKEILRPPAHLLSATRCRPGCCTHCFRLPVSWFRQAAIPAVPPAAPAKPVLAQLIPWSRFPQPRSPPEAAAPAAARPLFVCRSFRSLLLICCRGHLFRRFVLCAKCDAAPVQRVHIQLCRRRISRGKMAVLAGKILPIGKFRYLQKSLVSLQQLGRPCLAACAAPPKPHHLAAGAQLQQEAIRLFAPLIAHESGRILQRVFPDICFLAFKQRVCGRG